MTGRNGTGRPKRLAAALVAGWLLLIPATLAGVGGRTFQSIAAAFADGSMLPGAGDLLAAVRSLRTEPEDYGAGGNLPESDTLSPELIEALSGPSTGDIGTAVGPLATVPPGSLGIPGVVLVAYERAAATLAATTPNCGLHWSVLAAIGRIESGHAAGGSVDAQGNTLRPILGPVLSGGPGIAAIRDSDGGALDGDTVWDRAVGPMQFIPTTWASYATDGNSDGVANPHNIFDAALAAGRYLCAGGGDLRDPVMLAKAIFRYNHSDSYVANVLSWVAAYAAGVTPLPSLPPAGELPVAAPPPAGEVPPVGEVPPPGTTTPPPTSTTTPPPASTTVPPTTTTPTCPTAPPTTTDPTTTTPTTTPPPGCETTTPPPSSTEEPPTATQTQSSASSPAASDTSAVSESSSGTTTTMPSA